MKRVRVSTVQEGNGSETSKEGGGNWTRARMAAIGRKLKASAKPMRRSLRIAGANNKRENEITEENQNMDEVVEVEMAVVEEEEKKKGEKSDIMKVEEDEEKSNMTRIFKVKEEEEEKSEKKKILKAEGEEEKSETLVNIFKVAEEEEESDKSTNIMEVAMKREVMLEEANEKKKKILEVKKEKKKINIFEVEPPQEGEIMLDVDWPTYLTYEEEWLWTKRPGFTCEINNRQDDDWQLQLWSFDDS